MEIIGELVTIIYKNELNAYTIAEIETDEEVLTVVGYLPFINEGDSLKIVGKYIEHKEYGKQFRIDTFEKLMPLTLSALKKYLGSGNIKGIGEKTAEKIVDKFGEETIHVLKLEPKRLAEIRGINEEKALAISEEFITNWEVWQIVGFLDKFGIGAESAKKVFDLLGVNAIQEIESNPYVLIDIARVDFRQIDIMALKLGIDQTNIKRVQSGIKYALLRSTSNGHSCVLKHELLDFVAKLLDIEYEIIENYMINLQMKNEIFMEKQEEGEYIYLYSYYATEVNIANRIRKLQKSENMKKISDIKTELKLIENKSDIDLSDKQKEAVELVNDNNVVIITGGPGTGKTTVIKTIIDIYEAKEKKVVLCAPTGRAAKRITETTGREASTLHRLLEIGKIDENPMNNNAERFESSPIDADIVIIDEVSMVDMFLINYVLKSIYQGTKLILVGDKDQLSSVGPGTVLKDFIESESIATVNLEKIFRQAAQSKIILNAHKVNNGEIFIAEQSNEENNIKDDFFYIKESIQEKMLSQVISLCTGRLKKYGDYDFFQNIQVLTPTKKGMLGTKELNQSLQIYLNPHKEGKIEVNSMGAIYRIGDRVMQIKNNYEIYWEKSDLPKKEMGHGVFNGEIGTIINIYPKEKQIEIKFDDEKIAIYENSELDQIEHSYAITIHKSQGSEFDVVILVLPQSAPMLLTRNLLYTAITRAKKMLVLIGNDRVVNYMIQNIDSKKRNTGLKFKLQQ